MTSSTITYSDTTTGSVCGMITIPLSSELCLNWTCRHAFEVSSSSCRSSSDFTITAFATNLFGNGPISSPVYIKKAVLQPQCESSKLLCMLYVIKLNHHLPLLHVHL